MTSGNEALRVIENDEAPYIIVFNITIINYNYNYS